MATEVENHEEPCHLEIAELLVEKGAGVDKALSIISTFTSARHACNADIWMSAIAKEREMIIHKN